MKQREIVRLPVVGQLRPHVSYSEIRLFDECQYKWYLTKVLGEERDERSLPMEFGSAVHSVMEHLWADERPDLDALDRFFWESFDKNIEGLELSEEERADLPRLRELGPKIVRDALWCDDLKGIVPLRTELKLFEPISRDDGLDVKFKGFIDFIFVKKLKTKRVIYIADFKTCVWGWPMKKAQDPKVQAQILLYKHFFCKLTGAEPRDVSAAFILLKKAPPPGVSTIEVLKIGAGPKPMSEAIDFLQTTISRMHSGEYERNRGACVREWTDRATKQKRQATCPHLGHGCPRLDEPVPLGTGECPTIEN